MYIQQEGSELNKPFHKVSTWGHTRCYQGIIQSSFTVKRLMGTNSAKAKVTLWERGS